MTVYVSAYFNEEEFQTSVERSLEDRLIHYLLGEVSENQWMYHHQEGSRHWVIFMSSLLEHVSLPDDVELVTFMDELKANQFNTYCPCSFCGLLVFNYPGCTYRDINNCVGRSFECCHCQGLINEAIFNLLDIQRSFGTGAAVYHLVTECITPLNFSMTADLSADLSALERDLLEVLVKQDPSILDGHHLHFHSTLLAQADLKNVKLHEFRQELLRTRFRAYPLCTTCNQVLFGYPGVKDEEHPSYVHCLDCETLSNSERQIVNHVYTSTGLQGREAFEEAKKRMEARRSVEVLDKWTPVQYFDEEGYYYQGFIIANSHQLEAGTTFDANEISLNYHVVDARSIAQAKYYLEKETHPNWVHWSDVEVEDGFVQPDDSFVIPESKQIDSSDDDDLPF